MTPTETLELLRKEIARKMAYHEAKYAAGEPGDGSILYHGGAHDTLRDLQALVGEPKKAKPRLASEMPGWVGSEPPPDVLTEDDSWDRWPA